MDELPQIDLVLIGCVIGGVVCWIFGGRLLKPLAVVAGLAAGGVAGFASAPYIPADLSPWWPTGGGAILGALVAAAGFRFLTAALLCASLAVAAPMGVFAHAEVTGRFENHTPEPLSDDELLIPSLDGPVLPDDDETFTSAYGAQAEFAADVSGKSVSRDLRRAVADGVAEVVAEIDALSKRITEINSAETPSESETPQDEGSAEWKQQVAEVTDFALESASHAWQELPGGLRFDMTAFALGGVVVGLVLGLAAPLFAAGLTAGLAGAGLGIVGGMLLLQRSAIVSTEFVADHPGPLIAGWLIAGVIGLFLQWPRRKRAAAAPVA